MNLQERNNQRNVSRVQVIVIFFVINRNWHSPDLLQFRFFFFFSFFLFFLITHSQAAFVNCLYVARLTIEHSKTQTNELPIIIIIISKRAVTMKGSKTPENF